MMKVNVLHLVWNLIRGGTEGQCARVAMELASRGQRHVVMAFRRDGYFVPAVEKVCGRVDEIGITGMLEFRTLSSIRRLARRLRKEKFDILHTWDADAAIFGQFAASWADVPLITSRRDLGHIYPVHKVVLLNRADRKARAVVANAQAIKRVFARRGSAEDKFRVIPNILDAQEFDALAAKDFPRGGELPPGERVVMVSRLDPEKDIPTFIYAAEIVLQSHPDASFVLAGDGVERRHLESLALGHALMRRFVFLGETTDVPSLLRQCRIGVLTPSRNEGLSNTILEYMAAGLPVVATDCGGNRELVDPPNGGAIVPAGDAGELAKAIVGYLRTPHAARAAGERNRLTVARNFRPDSVGDRFQALYEEIVRK